MVLPAEELTDKPVKGSNQSPKKIAPFDNPCAKEQDLSYKCLGENGYDRDKCTLAFLNYKACQDFWNKVRAERRRKGIYPYLPGPEERKAIQDKYFSRGS